MNNKEKIMISRNLSNLIDVDILITILRLAFYNPETADSQLTITYGQIMEHLNFGSFVSYERVNESLLTLLQVSFNIDGLKETPVISSFYLLENGVGVTIYFHPKISLAIKRGYIFDGLDYMPIQNINREAKERLTL